MGIPTFFRSILQKNRNIVQGAIPATAAQPPIDYFFIDFNSIIYNTWAKIHKRLVSQDEKSIHDELIQQTISLTCRMVNDIVQPQKYLYISMDGVAPRAKMVQQRSRRYKSVQLKEILKAKTVEFNETKHVEWDPSPNICPGTPFMEKLNAELRTAMKKKKFNCEVYLSDSSVPGEGEHKFLRKIRALHENDATKDDQVIVYSPDGDMISLCLLTHKNNIRIMRIPDPYSEHEAYFAKHYEFIYCDLNLVRTDFFELLTSTYQDPNIEELRILNDYNFLLFMVGNDFVSSLPFLKIRSGGLDLMIRIYNEIRPEIKDYLIDYHPKTQPDPKIHRAFFERLLLSLAKAENGEMTREYNQIQKEMSGVPTRKRVQQEQGLSPYQLFESRFQHLCFFNPDHPEYSRYKALPDKINYRLPKHEWKEQYYTHFFDINTKNQHEYNIKRTEIVENYFESLVFTLRYYLKGCPCFNWHYRYRVSPIPSDMLTVLTKHGFNINGIKFKNDPPFQPFEQLMFILPPQMKNLLPKPLGEIMESKECEVYYPRHFEIDALAGVKYIYSEAVLPEIDGIKLRAVIADKSKLLVESEKKRNTNSVKIVHTKAPKMG